MYDMYDMLQVQNIPNAHQTVRWPALCMPSLTHQGEENILKNKELILIGLPDKMVPVL